jgi:hypothetical protein
MSSASIGGIQQRDVGRGSNEFVSGRGENQECYSYVANRNIELTGKSRQIYREENYAW